MVFKKNLASILLCLLAQPVFSQCSVLQIVVDKESICAPGILRFHLINSVAGSSYEWNVGNGLVFGADTLYSFYSTATEINARVKVTLPGGEVCTIVEDAIAIVNPVPIPQFTASKTILCNGADSLTLTDITTNSVKRSWVVAGTNYGNTLPSIKHQFINAGAKKISLIVEDSNGCQGVNEFFDTIQIYSMPNFDFSGTVRNGCAPRNSTFTLTQDPSMAPFTKKYYWTFPGASNVADSGTNPAARTYSSIGRYEVTLRVEVDNGCTYTKEKRNYLSFGELVNLNVTSSDTVQCFNEDIKFLQNTPSLPGIVTWSFSGVPNTIISSNRDSAVVSVSGVGDLDLTIYHNQFGCISTENYSQIVEVKGVKADFSSLDHFHCAVPHTVHLDNESDTLDASAVTYKWDILDGDTSVFTSTAENPNFTFNTLPATYDVQLIAIGDNGCSDTFIRNNYIYQDSLKMIFDVAPKQVCIDQEFQILNNTKPSTYLGRDSFNWYFFDTNNVTLLDSSDERAPTFSYSNTGFYDILAIGYNSAGCRDTLRLNDIVKVISASLDFEVITPIICTGDRMYVNGKSSPADADFNYLWILKHKTSSSVYKVSGDSTFLYPRTLGEYHAIYRHDIAGGCVDLDTVDAWVNGLTAKVDLDTSFGCAPLTINPSATILSDFYEGQASASYAYEWFVTPDNGVNLQDTFSSLPTFEFSQNGDYVISVIITNSVGCTYTASSKKILNGVRSGLQVLNDRICLGDTLFVYDNSYNGVSNVTWIFRPGANYTLSNSDSNLNKIVLEQPGTYQLRQIVTNNNICSDTSYYPFEVIGVIADFEAIDSFLNCAPIYAEFVSESSFADTLIWDFGTGDIFKTTSTSAGTIYSMNSGLNNGYDITLIAKNVLGCTDTLVKEDYMVVAGPVPKFTMTNFIGCEPLSVSFIDESEDESYFYMNYNDGSMLDSSKNDQNIIGTHTYTIKSFGALRQTVMPSIIVYDSLGCASVFEPADSVEIFRSPVTNSFFANGIESCNAFNIIFEDTGDFIDTRQWSMDGVNISTQSKDSTISTVVGKHILQLVATNSKSCTDTMTQVVGVFETPEVSFTIQDTVCIYTTADFVGAISSTNAVDFFEWNFDELGSPGNLNSTDMSTSFTYQTTGIKRIRLYSGLENGCKDSAVQTITITDESDIDNPQINFVSFKDNYTLEIDFQSSTNSKFNQYTISDGVTDNIIDDININNVEINLGSEPMIPQCYTLQVGDFCDLKGLTSIPHCFIKLQIFSSNPYENELLWSAYEGWARVSKYTIYRKDNNDVFIKLNEVDGLTTSYVDKGLCDQNYEYYVQAEDLTSTYKSNSYSVTNRPIYVFNTLNSSVSNVSVVGENKIAIDWEKSTFSEFKNYKVVKYETSFDNLISETPVTDTFFIDNDVLTNEYSYIYRVVEQDRCQYDNTSDREGKSILLRGRYNDGSDLFWTEYQNWESGVEKYNVEIDKAGSFEFTHKNSHLDRDYIDKKYYRDITGEYCYRVYGVSNDGDTSYSNVVCLSGEPKVLIPTGFTPNGDYLNDAFNPISQFILQGDLEEVNSFLFSIYNRWGEKLYETDNITEGWNGTYEGSQCQQGAYMYTLTATGINKKKVYLKGSVILLR